MGNSHINLNPKISIPKPARKLQPILPGHQENQHGPSKAALVNDSIRHAAFAASEYHGLGFRVRNITNTGAYIYIINYSILVVPYYASRNPILIIQAPTLGLWAILCPNHHPLNRKLSFTLGLKIAQKPYIITYYGLWALMYELLEP